MFSGLKNIKAVSFFVWAALIFEIAYNIVTPPLQSPDEFNHFYRAYQVSQGGFLPVKLNNRLGGYIPEDMIDFVAQYRQCDNIKNYTITYQEIQESFNIKSESNQNQFVDFANTAFYSPVSYLPQAIAIGILTSLHARPAVLYYGAKLFIFLVWLFCVYKVINLLPVFKWLFTLLALLPMHMHIVNSLSADTVTNILSFLILGLGLKHIFITERIKPQHLLVFCLLLVLLALAKVVYIGIAIILFAIPAQKFPGFYFRAVGLLGILLVTALSAYLLTHLVMIFYISPANYDPSYVNYATVSRCSDYHAQKKYIFSHGTYFCEVVWATLTTCPDAYLSDYIGVFNGQVKLPGWLCVVSYIFILMAVLAEGSAYLLCPGEKFVMLIAASVSFVLLLLSQHLMWDCVGADIVGFLQGRYLIPILPLVFIALNNSYFKVRLNLSMLVIPLILFLNLFSVYAIYERYFIEPECEKTEFFCNAEETNHKGAFKTSAANIFVSGAADQTAAQHHSGKYSVLLSVSSPYCFTYTTEGLHKGDLIEVTAWEKGSGALLITSARQDGCGDFYFGGTVKSASDPDGWTLIKTKFSYPLTCDSAVLGIYAVYSGKSQVYLDDLHIKISRFKKDRK